MKRVQPNATSAESIYAGREAQFGRWWDVKRLFGIKRGKLYRLMKQRKILGHTDREPGRKFGCRYFYLPSIQKYFQSQMEAQNPDITTFSPQITTQSEEDTTMNWVISKGTMIIKAKTKGARLAEGTYHATLTTVTVKPNEEAPKKVSLGFEIDGTKHEVAKEVQPTLDEDSHLRRDAQTLLQREFSKAEAEAGLDLNTLVGKRAKITVVHRGGPGGKLIPVVTLIQAPDSDHAADAALEAAFTAPTTTVAVAADPQPAN